LTTHGDIWAPAGVVVAGAGALAGFAVWSWRHVVRFVAWFRHDERIGRLEANTATKTDVAELKALASAHETRDTAAFDKINADLGTMRDHMAKGSDLARVESKLDTLLLDGFRHAP
jgi:hypothetical protein